MVEKKLGEFKGKGKSQANIMEKMEDANDLCAMTSECNFFGNQKVRFIESSATRHICSAKETLRTYNPAEYDEGLFMARVKIIPHMMDKQSMD